MGGLLGDLTIVKRQNSYRVKVAHSPKNKDYVYWKYEQLKRLCHSTQPPVLNGKNLEFYLSSSLIYKPLHEIIYQAVQTSNKVKYVKTITQKLIDSLPTSNLLLAVWFMDDGNARNDCYAGRIAAMSFSYDEQVLLLDYIKSRYNIDGKIILNSKLKNHYQIIIPAKSFGKFVKLIQPFVEKIPSMVYKLNLERKKSSKYFRETP